MEKQEEESFARTLEKADEKRVVGLGTMQDFLKLANTKNTGQTLLAFV